MALSAGAHGQEAAPAPAPVWYGSAFDSALRLAEQRDTLVLLFFWMPGSQHCDKVWADTLSNAVSEDRRHKLVCFTANATEGEGVDLLRRYNVTTVPTLLFVNGRGQAEEAVIGSFSPNEFAQQVDRVLAGRQTVSQLRQLASADPDDLELRFDLALKLLHVGDNQMGEVLIESIRDADPRGETTGGARILVRDATLAVTEKASDPSDPKTFDLSGVIETLRRLPRPEIAFAGWAWVAGIERRRGAGEAARRAYAEAWRVLPEQNRMAWPATVAVQYWQMRAELKDDDRRFLRGKLEEVYAPVYEAAAAREDYSGMTDQEREAAANQIVALARGWFLDGEAERAIQAAELALRLRPDNEEITRLLQELRT